jgi:AraC-like DNA-binding protein
MDYFTVGKEHFPGKRLPLIYSREAFLAEREEKRLQFLFLEQGTLLYSAGDGLRSCRAPVVMLLNPTHRVEELCCEGQAEVHNFVFRRDALNACLFDSSDDDAAFILPLAPFHSLGERGFLLQKCPAGCYSRFGELCRKMDLHLNRQVHRMWPCLARSYLLEILILLERTRHLNWEGGEMIVPSEGTWIDEILAYLHANLHVQISLEDLARRFGTNRTSLNEAFRGQCGVSVMAYLGRIRIEMAEEMLKDTNLPVSEISDRVGISDGSYFSKAFKKKTGQSPSDFRRSLPSSYATI